MALENDVQEPDANDDYAAAFNEASGDVPAAGALAAEPTPAPADEPTPAVTEDKTPADAGTVVDPEAAANAATPAPVVPPVPVPATEPAPAPVPATEPAPVPAPAAAAPALDPKFLAQALAEAQTLREQSQQAAPEPAPAPKLLTTADFLKPEDTAVIEKFKTEWPDEYVAVEKMANAHVQAILGNRINQLNVELNTVLAPLFASMQKTEVNSHEAVITAAHPDANAIAPAVAEWAKSQPALHRNVYLNVLAKGNAAEVVELLGIYKQSVGHPSAAPATPASVTPQPVPAPAAKPVPASAAATLAAVPISQRGKSTAAVDPNDFESAFAQASADIAVNS